MRVLVIENYADTPLGQVERALNERGAEIDLRRPYDGDPLPDDHTGHDAAVLLGGSQTALDDEDYPFLPHEAELGKRFGDADKAVLGICLGAQVLARGFGARNVVGRPIEFGWYPVSTTDDGSADPVLSALGKQAPQFHWHTDTFTLPEGAVHLASSAETPNQAFRIGRACYSIQFHFEADKKLLEMWNVAFAHEIVGHTPDWFGRFAEEAERHGAIADAVGLELARRWADLI